MLIGEKLDEEHKHLIYKKVNTLLKIDNPITNYKFIGNHPVSLTNDNIILLLKNDYMVCEKSDGIRVLLFMLDNVLYFYDRKNEIYKVENLYKENKCLDNREVDEIKENDTLVKRRQVSNTINNCIIKDCILDGELFYDNTNKLKYAIFDCLVYDGEIVLNRNLLKRLYYCEKFVKEINDNKNETQNKQIDINTQSISKIDFYVKAVYKSYGFLEIYKQIKDLKHKNDGLIFTPVHDDYILYKRGTHLKWKPPHVNTIDFRTVRYKGVFELKCIYKNTEAVFDYYYDISDIDLDGKIVEFIYDKDKIVLDIENHINKIGGWVLYKIRDDKSTPNHYRVVNNILESLDDDLDIEELSRYYKPMRNNYKLREGKR